MEPLKLARHALDNMFIAAKHNRLEVASGWARVAAETLRYSPTDDRPRVSNDNMADLLHCAATSMYLDRAATWCALAHKKNVS